MVTDYVLKVLGLDVCADTLVGDGMVRGISGGQKKRVTTGKQHKSKMCSVSKLACSIILILKRIW